MALPKCSEFSTVLPFFLGFERFDRVWPSCQYLLTFPQQMAMFDQEKNTCNGVCVCVCVCVCVRAEFRLFPQSVSATRDVVVHLLRLPWRGVLMKLCGFFARRLSLRLTVSGSRPANQHVRNEFTCCCSSRYPHPHPPQPFSFGGGGGVGGGRTGSFLCKWADRKEASPSRGRPWPHPHHHHPPPTRPPPCAGPMALQFFVGASGAWRRHRQTPHRASRVVQSQSL